jgi:hypothetical protein
LADLLRGNQNGQEYLAKTVVPVPHPSQSSENDAKSSSYDQILIPPRPAVMSLIVVAVGAEYLESYSTRAAATYAFEVDSLILKLFHLLHFFSINEPFNIIYI